MEFFWNRHLRGFCPHLLFIQSFMYISVDSWIFVLYFELYILPIYFVIQIVPVWYWKFIGSCVPLTYHCHCRTCSFLSFISFLLPSLSLSLSFLDLISDNMRWSRLILDISCFKVRISHLPRRSDSFYWIITLEMKSK